MWMWRILSASVWGQLSKLGECYRAGHDVGPWACFLCCCGSVRVYFGRVSVCSLNRLMRIQRTYDCSHDGAAELSRSYQCTGQTSVHGAWPSFPMRIRAGAFEHSIERTMHAARTRACGARACGKSLGRGAARACGARGAAGGKPFYPPEVFFYAREKQVLS